MKKMLLLLGTASLLTTFACKKSPKPGQYAYCHLTVRYDDSVVFSSREQGDTVRMPMKDPKKMDNSADGTIKPLNEAILKMRVGDTSNVVQLTDTMKVKPPQLANVKKITYGIKLLDVKSEAQFKAESEAQQNAQKAKQEKISAVLQTMTADSTIMRNRQKAIADSTTALAKDYLAGTLNGKIKTTASGLKYIILKEGAGQNVKKGDVAAMQYYGALTTGNRFDDSYSRGQFFPVQVGVGQVIPGWDQGLQLLKEGSIAVLFVPSKLGYGDRAMPGQKKGEVGIPANSELVFYMEVLKRFDYQ